jgi:hypothetical protein
MFGERTHRSRSSKGSHLLVLRHPEYLKHQNDFMNLVSFERTHGYKMAVELSNYTGCGKLAYFFHIALKDLKGS